MQINVNEKLLNIPDDISLLKLRAQLYPLADIIIRNGTPSADDCQLKQGDRIIFIQRTQQPTAEELETLLSARHTPAVHNKLKNATVGIAGLGGLGSAIAIALTRAGIGKLIIADFDVVEPSNLHRQQYFIDQIGMTKVDALTSNLKRINPFNTVCGVHQYLSPGNIPAIFSAVDVMVEAFDQPESKAMLAGLWLQQFPHTPLVAASGMAGYASSNSIKTRRALNNLYLCGDGVSAVGQETSLMAPRVGIAAHHQANTVIRLLLGIDPIEKPLKRSKYADQG